MITTLEKELMETETDVCEVDKETLCKTLCVNILEGLMSGYSDLKIKNPDKERDFQKKIEDLQKQLQLR